MLLRPSPKARGGARAARPGASLLPSPLLTSPYLSFNQPANTELVQAPPECAGALPIGLPP